jgi:hypothetical protein
VFLAEFLLSEFISNKIKIKVLHNKKVNDLIFNDLNKVLIVA